MSNAELLRRRQAAVPSGVASATPLFVERALNAEIWDADGRRFLDFAQGIAVGNTGHCHPKVMAAAKVQCDKYAHTAFQVLQYEPYVRLAERVNRIAPIGDAKTLFFSTGAEAVENAILLDPLPLYRLHARGSIRGTPNVGAIARAPLVRTKSRSRWS